MSSQLKRVASDSDSESESESEEEGTNVSVKAQEPLKQQKQQGKAESGSESETDSDSEPESRYNIVKRDFNSKVAAKAPANDKRRRDVNGAKDAAVEEPASKKRKGSKEDKAHSQPEKISSPVKVSSPVKKVEKADPATRATKATAGGAKAKAAPAAKVENARPQAAGRKRRASPPPPPDTSAKKQASKVEEKSSPMKPKKITTWSNAVEESLVCQLLKDHSSGLVIPSKGDPYWEKLLKRVALEEDVSGAQVCEKVRRMKLRYQTLKERAKSEGAKPFKSPHEEKIFQMWANIWGPETKTLPPPAEEDDSDDDSVDTATAPGQVTKPALVQVKQEESSTDEEDEEDAEDAEDTKRKADGLNQVAADSKVIPELPVVSPFISKPRLAFTPLVPKGDKRNISRRIDEEEEEEAAGELHTEAIVPIGDGKKGDVVNLAEEHLKQLRYETLTFFQEVRGTYLMGGLGGLAFAGNGFGFSGMLEGFKAGSQSQAAVDLQKKWREHKIQELALLSNRLELLQEQVRLQQEELKLQNQRLD